MSDPFAGSEVERSLFHASADILTRMLKALSLHDAYHTKEAKDMMSEDYDEVSDLYLNLGMLIMVARAASEESRWEVVRTILANKKSPSR